MGSTTQRSLFGLGAVMLLASSVLSWTDSASAVGPTMSSLTAELERASGGKAKVAVRAETGAATFVGGSLDAPLQAAAGGTPSIAASAVHGSLRPDVRRRECICRPRGDVRQFTPGPG